MPEVGEKLRVVLVEDDRDLADVTQLALELEGLEVAVAYDGREALQVIERTRPHVVITDLIMPVLDGLQLIERIRSTPAIRSPVIAVSAVGSRLRLARELGAAEALVKPVHPRELAECARKAWRRDNPA
ncbi:MAG TPA: response regulator [Myxococcales bacterium]|nr:response regulator [Myxococcales bacterium]